MARGNKPLEKKEYAEIAKMKCLCCKKSFNGDEFYDSDSELYASIGKLPYCKECIDRIYRNYLEKYIEAQYDEPERKAVDRVCMAMDLYYDDKLFEAAIKEAKVSGVSVMSKYIKKIKLYQYRKKNYDTTLSKKFSDAILYTEPVVKHNEEDDADIKDAIKVFGEGFTKDDYRFLIYQYRDWTTRHECETKSQEEVFKQICFTQLELSKAARTRSDTKDLNMTFLKQLEAAKLQPKQNKGETVSDTQTFGTLIDKWENTRPLPEIDEELRDVDKIGLYLDVFFKGHLAKMMGLKNGLSNLYSKYMEKYTVKKPEYSGEEDSDALFDAIFGNQDNMND